MLLSCPLCCKPHFEGVDSLRTTLVNVATAPLKCPVCQDVLKGLDKLTIHLFGHVSEGAPQKEEKFQEEIDSRISKICDKSDPKTPEDTVVQNPSQPIISCDICSFTFTDKNILELHQKLLHQTSPDEKTGKYSYHCHLCSKRFRMRGSLMVHLRVAHYGFNNHIDLPTHLLTQSENATSQPTSSSVMDIDAQSKVSSPKTPDCKQWSCDVCAKMFTTKYFLKKHKRLHTGEMPYSCSICNKAFTFQQSYHKHMLYHSSEKPYQCNECGRAFKEHSTLQNHARIHSGERPFACEICGKRFRQRVSYLVHMRIHTGVMPYKCTACNKSFRYKVSQRSHKCPVNPPGSVVRISEPSETMVASPKATVTSPAPSSENGEAENPLKVPKCIMSVDYDTGCINLIPNEHLMKSPTRQSPLINEKDMYTMVMSPILPEVESLCLNSNSPVTPNSPIEETIQIIREKCLEELFK
ncbi:zinc finger protein ZFP2 [Anthonomus grandis grandis]|uniref:zinc finger protein ZFP2 n=1 Tax=Anthonomus grandis grandis TaxID=2921223 RepID=UPI00216624AE|nr:zinc finger protein ZFP2 [Anthonomus grandis grandis]